MEIKKLTDKLSVSPQIVAADLDVIKTQGFKAIICNRPDGEGADQPTFAEIEKAAHKAGLEAHYIPVVSGQMRDDDVAAFGAMLNIISRPVLAYCRSGTRSATLWSLHEAKKRELSTL